jgi:hypothetical protein
MNIIRCLFLWASLVRLSVGQEQQDADEVTSFTCALPCLDTQFCGRDLTCHAYSCQAWYTLGHPFFTHYIPGTSEDLFCDDYFGEDRTFLQQPLVCGAGRAGGALPLAAEYLAPNASATSCYFPNREEQLATITLSQKCTAQPSEQTGFICYDISNFPQHWEDTSQAFVERSEALNITGGTYSYNLYVNGYAIQQENGQEFPSYMGEFRPLGEDGDRSVFNATAARSAMHARAFLVFESPLHHDCAGGCRLSEFCGKDGLCHEIDCDHFWDYGPVEFTGNSDEALASGVDLNCTLEPQEAEANPCDEQWPLALEYRCEEPYVITFRSPACQPNDNDARGLPFHRTCAAKPNPTQEFVCFDLKGAPNMVAFTTDYLQTTVENPQCTDAELVSWDGSADAKNDTEWVAYHYQTHGVRNDGYSTPLYFEVPYQRASDEEDPLDLDALKHAMYASLVGKAPPSDATMRFSGGATFWGFLAAIVYIGFFTL